MSKIPINEILAANLKYFMEQTGLNPQSVLAEKVGLAQRTIGNYLKPSLRVAGSTGKAPSAKLSEVEKIAEALGIEVWQLLRPMSSTDRVIYQRVEQAFQEVKALTTGSEHPSAHVLHDHPEKRWGT